MVDKYQMYKIVGYFRDKQEVTRNFKEIIQKMAIASKPSHIEHNFWKRQQPKAIE